MNNIKTFNDFLGESNFSMKYFIDKENKLLKKLEYSLGDYNEYKENSYRKTKALEKKLLELYKEKSEILSDMEEDSDLTDNTDASIAQKYGNKLNKIDNKINDIQSKISNLKKELSSKLNVYNKAKDDYKKFHLGVKK